MLWRRRELITDVRKPEILFMTSLWASLPILDHPRKLVTLNHQINRRRTRKLPVGGMPASSLAWKTSLEKSGRCGIAADGAWRFTWLIVVISVRQSTVAAISGLHCRALVMVSSNIRLTAWLQNSKKRAERSEIDVWAESPRLSPLLVICIIIYLSWAVNHYRDNAIAYQSPARPKMPNRSWRTAITDIDASAYCCCARCKIHEERLADLFS